MYKFLFLDLDETILDFHKAEHIAVSKAFQDCGVEPTEPTIALYSRINIDFWERLERGEVSREQVKLGRFEETFRQLGIQADARRCAEDYERLLGIGHYFLPGAEAAVHSLAEKYRLFLASNGTASVQAGRLTSAKLYPYFEKVFVSEELGVNKPSKAFFDRCFAQIPDFDPRQTLMVGDSLSSDIRGGNNAGIATCWVNRRGAARPTEPHVDYEITALSELEGLLERLSGAAPGV